MCGLKRMYDLFLKKSWKIENLRSQRLVFRTMINYGPFVPFSVGEHQSKKYDKTNWVNLIVFKGDKSLLKFQNKFVLHTYICVQQISEGISVWMLKVCIFHLERDKCEMSKHNEQVRVVSRCNVARVVLLVLVKAFYGSTRLAHITTSYFQSLVYISWPGLLQ